MHVKYIITPVFDNSNIELLIGLLCLQIYSNTGWKYCNCHLLVHVLPSVYFVYQSPHQDITITYIIYICISYTPPLLGTWRIYLSVRKRYTEGEARGYCFLTLKYIPMYPAKVGYNKYVSRQNDRKYVSVVNTDEKFARKDFFGSWKRQ